jgi:hypothetical protein
LNGLKTCSEIGEYIHRNESTMQWAAGDGPNSQSDGNGKVDRSDAMVGIHMLTIPTFSSFLDIALQVVYN